MTSDNDIPDEGTRWWSGWPVERYLLVLVLAIVAIVGALLVSEEGAGDSGGLATSVSSMTPDEADEAFLTAFRSAYANDDVSAKMGECSMYLDALNLGPTISCMDEVAGIFADLRARAEAVDAADESPLGRQTVSTMTVCHEAYRDAGDAIEAMDSTRLEASAGNLETCNAGINAVTDLINAMPD